MRKLIAVGLALTLAILVGLGLRGLVAQQSARDGVMQPVSPGQTRGEWKVTTPEPPTQVNLIETRRATMESGKQITDYLVPGVQEMEINDRTVTPWMAFGGKNEFADLGRRADVVVVGRVAKIHAELNESTDWVNSTVDLHVEQVLKSGSGLADISAGQTVSIQIRGGIVAVDGVRVTAKGANEELPELTKRYLYFLAVSPTTFIPPDRVIQAPQLLPFPWVSTFEIRGESLRRLERNVKERKGSGQDEKEIGFAQALAEVRGERE